MPTLISKVAHSIFTLVTPVIALPAKDYQKQTCSLTDLLPHCNRASYSRGTDNISLKREAFISSGWNLSDIVFWNAPSRRDVCRRASIRSELQRRHCIQFLQKLQIIRNVKCCVRNPSKALNLDWTGRLLLCTKVTLMLQTRVDCFVLTVMMVSHSKFSDSL